MARPQTLRLILFVLTGMFLPSLQFAQSPLILSCRALFEQRNFALAKKALTAIPKGSLDYAEAQYYLGRVAVEEREYNVSIERFESAIDSNPQSAEYHNWLGVMYGVLAISANPFKQAYLAPKIKGEFEIAAALDPHNLQTQWGLISYYTNAPGFLGGSWEKALDCAQVISNHDKAQGLRAFATVHAAQKKPVLAEREFKEAIQKEPTNCEHVFALAGFYKERQQYAKAFDMYEAAIKNFPHNMVAVFHFGQLAARQGDHVEKGILCLDQYLTYTPKPNEPSHADALVSLAALYEKSGDTVNARNYYESTLRLEPGMKEAKEGLERLN